MAKDAKQLMFGIHGVTIIDYWTGKPVAELDVIGDLSLPVSAEVESLFGGSHVWPVAGEPKTLSCDGQVTLKEYPEDLAEYLVAGVGAKVAAESTGSVVALTNDFGTSVMSATTGIASVGLKSGKTADLKAGMYLVVATAAGAVDVYAYSSVDAKKGTDLTIQDDEMKITATPLTITMGAATEIPNLGVELTGGSGTIGMTIGDTAVFEIYPPHAGVETMTMGQANAEFKRVRLFLAAQKRTTGEIGYIYCPNALALGLPGAMAEKGWSDGSLSLSIFTHETLGFSMKFTNIKGIGV